MRLTQEDKAKIIEKRNAGQTLPAIAEEYHVSLATINRTIKAATRTESVAPSARKNGGAAKTSITSKMAPTIRLVSVVPVPGHGHMVFIPQDAA